MIRLDVFKTSLSLLNKKEKLKLFIYCIICFISFALDILTVFSIFPFINIILDPNLIYETNKYNYLWTYLGSPNINLFIVYLSVAIILVILSSSLFSLYTQYRLNLFVAKCQTRLGNDLIRNFTFMNYEWHIQQNSIKLMNLFSYHLAYWSRGVIKQIPLLAGYLSSLMIPLLTILILSPKYGILIISFISIIIFKFLKYIRKKTNLLTNGQRIKIDEINVFLTEMLAGIKDVKLSNNTFNFLNKFNNIWGKFAFGQASIENLNLLPVNSILMFSQLCVVFLGTILFISNINQNILVGIMAIITLLAFKIVPLLNKLGNSLNNISNAHIYSKTLKIIYSEVVLKVNKRDQLFTNSCEFYWKQLSLVDVSYSYPKSNKICLKRINLQINKGLHYGFVGFSGAGKSTTIDLCNGLLSPSKGRVLIDGIDLEEFGIEKWQSKIGYVPQNPKINDLSIKENVAFGLDPYEIDEEKVMSCLEIVGLGSFVQKLPLKLSTQLRERGKILSGGQLQLVAIARALYEEPNILILDEATNSLDSITQELVRAVFKKLHGKVTLLSISHQFSNLKFVDHVFLFESGELIDQGNFKDLYSNSVLFKRFVDSQKDN
ncbi:ATP-binding cassette domain-containing protein [Prochlorococcus marinus]|uniref:ATP-binding cassette domain-containing protein n=1 Tax=Prochlorococcus marinus TaxID=1219 RepID=UPI001ADB498B|nr:ABC transporter ATP-binding protein [Prochlorococcus marinus]MBO8230536.1 ABC transporter ATP-binding protein [Prochlorococcus marinus XMU1404]